MRNKSKDEMRHEERMAKMRNQHDIRMQKLRNKDEIDVEKQQTKAEKFLSKQKTMQDKAKNKSKVKLLAKLAVAAEVLKFMMDHHADEEQKLKTDDKIKLHKAGIGIKSKTATKQAAAKASKILKMNGMQLEPQDVQDIMSHTQSMDPHSFNALLQKIEGWIKKLYIQVSPSGKSGAATYDGYGVL